MWQFGVRRLDAAFGSLDGAQCPGTPIPKIQKRRLAAALQNGTLPDSERRTTILEIVLLPQSPTSRAIAGPTLTRAAWYGSKGLGEAKKLGGDGRLVIGIFGRTAGLRVKDYQLRGLGLVQLGKAPRLGRGRRRD